MLTRSLWLQDDDEQPACKQAKTHTSKQSAAGTAALVAQVLAPSGEQAAAHPRLEQHVDEKQAVTRLQQQAPQEQQLTKELHQQQQQTQHHQQRQLSSDQRADGGAQQH